MAWHLPPQAQPQAACSQTTGVSPVAPAVDSKQPTPDSIPCNPENLPVPPRTHTSSLSATLLLLFASLFITSALARLTYEILLGIPSQVVTEQSQIARDILSRQGFALAQARDSKHPEPEINRAQLEFANQDLLWIALVDTRGMRTLVTRSGRQAPVLETSTPVTDDHGFAAPPGSDPRIQVAQTGETLIATLNLGLTPPSTSNGQSEAPAPRSSLTATANPVSSNPTTTSSIQLALDLRRPRAAAWTQLHNPQAWLPWFGLTLLMAGISVLVIDRRIRQPLSRLLAFTQRITEDNPEIRTEPASGVEIADLEAGLNAMVQRLGASEAERQATEARWVYALEGSGDGVWDWDMTTGEVYLSNGWKAMLGYGPEEIEGRVEEWIRRIHPEDRALCQMAIDQHQQGQTPTYTCEHRLQAKDGTWRWVLDRGRIMERDAQGHGLRMIGTHADITERKLAERSLAYLVTLETVLVETSRALLAAQPEAVEPVTERVLGAVARRMDVERASVYVLDPDGLLLRATHSWDLGEGERAPDTLEQLDVARLPRWMETLRHGEPIRITDISHLPEAWSKDHDLLAEIGVRAIAAVPLRSAERLGGFVALEMRTAARHWRDSELRALHFLGDLIGAALERRKFELELLESRQRLEEIALYDTLTNLPNRHLLAERMKEAMASALESGTQLAVSYLDLDGFKPINDHFGHAVGDHILTTAAARLREQVRESDTVARLGGDEFVLLMGGFDNMIECANAMDRVIKLLAKPYIIEGKELRVTASAGVTLYPRDSHDADTLLRHADHAMYQAKQRGRNRCRFFDTVRDRQANARRSQLTRIGEAIETGELVMYYQPKVDMRQGLVLGAEGLVRWQHPQKGLLPPGAFIPLLDGSELQQRLDWWVLEAGIKQIESWHAQGLALELSLNISARSVQHEGFVTDLNSLLKRHPSLDPQALSLEILESEALGDLDAVAGVMERCQDLGVSFALDDFGTGYSSLTYFRRLPAQVLKIDQTFVRDMLRSSDDRNIVEGVVGLAHAFQRNVIAEGVESAAHGLMLLHMGCDLAQGYGIAEPMPAERFPNWVANYEPPLLWDLGPGFDWSGHILDLLTLESVHRDWVSQLLRSASSGAGGRIPELDEAHCGFGRWYLGDGKQLYGELDSFQAMDWLHERVHAQGREVLRAQDHHIPLGDAIQSLIQARDSFIAGLQRLQQQILSRVG